VLVEDTINNTKIISGHFRLWTSSHGSGFNRVFPSSRISFGKDAKRNGIILKVHRLNSVAKYHFFKS